MMRESGTVVRDEPWTAWPVYWTPVIVGALASVVAVVLFGVIGTAVGSWKAGNEGRDRKSTRLNSSHGYISYAVFCLKKKKIRYANALRCYDLIDYPSAVER